MVRVPDIHIDLDELNHSELVALARWSGLPASRAFPRDMLVESLESFRPVEADMPFDKMREDLSTWMKRWWSIFQMQVSKKVCPTCSLCKDLQVLDCYSKNAHQINPNKRRR